MAWLITGCSSGLGRSIATAVLERGLDAVVTARDPRTVSDLAERFGQSAWATSLDVTELAAIDELMRKAEDRFGSVDVLVNNAGHGFRAAVEEAEPDEVAEVFATNFFGPVALMRAVLPGMRARRSGTIVNMSSIGGRRAAPGSGYYSATKFALEGLSDALRKEVGPLGINVIVVDPGAFRTDFAGRSLQQSRAAIADYAETAGKRRKENDTMHGTQIGDPDRAAKAIVDTVTGDARLFRLALGSDAIEVIRSELTAQTAELVGWEALSRTTDFPA